MPGELEADAFVDPGADATMLSHRWALSCRREAAIKRALIVEPHPLLDFEGNILETVSVAIGQSGWLDLPSELQLARQGGPHPDQLRDMPGYEDILIGRDFLRLHNLLLVVDGSGEFSLLLPDDEDNAARREAILRCIS